MPVPSSGQISMSGIRSVGVSGGCTEGGGGSYSLSTLADNFGIGTNPDKMSDFYGLSYPGGPPPPGCLSSFQTVGNSVEQLCCGIPALEELFYYNNGFAPGQAANPWKLLSYTGTLYNGYINTGGGIYQVTNGVESGIPSACPPCPEECFCYSITLESMASFVSYIDCCGNSFDGYIYQNIVVCCSKAPNTDGNASVTQLGSCSCGQSCGKG